MRIGALDTADRAIVVAEIGNNHEGDPDLALELVRRAAECGADAVKFQTFRADEFVRPSDVERSQRYAGFELAPDVFARLRHAAHEAGLLFISTPLDLPSVAVLAPLVDAYKIASGDNDHYPLIARVCSTGKPVIVSTGLADLSVVRRAVDFVRARWRESGVHQDLAVLHCVTSYPVPAEQANVAAVARLAETLEDVTIGYSDHTLGTDACVVAVALGARIVEKHFTIDKAYSSFRDHAISADPPEMTELVRRIRATAVLLGSGEKVPQLSELELATSARRSIVAAADLPAGHVLALADLTWMRPADGLRPGEEGLVLGRALKRPLARGETVRPADLS